MTEENKCWIFGDEAGQIGADRFFAIGIIGTREPKELIAKIKEIREKTNYFGEVSYKSSDKRRALCSIRLMDWFFSGQKIAHCKILLKDRDGNGRFNVNYFNRNIYKTGATQLAYCQSYKEVLCNFAGYANDKKCLVYSQIGLAKMGIEDYLEGKVIGLTKSDCYSRLSKEKKKDGSEYTGTAEILQLCDLLTSSTRGLACSFSGEETSEDWVKNMLRKNIHYHVANIKDRLTQGQHVYFPSHSPFHNQTFAIFNWKTRS